MVPQLVILTAMSTALWLAARWVKREVARVDTEMRRAQSSLDRARNDRAPRLQLDARTGRYYPIDR